MQVSLKNMGTVNKNRVHIETGTYELTLYFSYQTIIGFDYYDRVARQGTSRVSVNEWSNTTGKFLNELEPNKKARIPHNDLIRELESVLNNTNPYQLPAL